MKRVFRYFLSVLLAYVILALTTPYISLLCHRSIENQISYLGKQLTKGLDNDLQMRFPEGFVFANALFALSVLEYSQQSDELDSANATYVDRAVKQLLSERARQSFSADLPLPYGAFYVGWTNLVLSNYRQSALFEYSSVSDKVITVNDSLNLTLLKIQADTVRPLESYFGSVWPGDNMACIASLPTTADSLRLVWHTSLQRASNCDSILLDHFFRESCEVRGSSQALGIYFLSLVDKAQADTANERYRSIFVESIFGVELVKEYQGDGYMDVDSGPIVAGYGAVATVMNTKAQASLSEGHYQWTWAWLNLAGVPVNILGNKYYLAKKEPMFDLFMLWCSVGI